MVEAMRQLVGRLLRPGIAAVILLIATLACYTPRQIQAEREAITQFTFLEESIYVPHDAALLAEVHFSGHSHEYASAGVEQVYANPRSCEEIVAEYLEAMADLGWTATPVGSCDKVIWLNMYSTSGGRLGIYAEPPQGSRLSDEWRLLQEQYEGLYYVLSNLTVWYEEP
jgi:hypothetical protein